MAFALVPSCLEVDIVMPEVEETQVSLSFKSSDIAQTRATEGEDDANNENDINTLDIFFYPSTAGANTAAVHHMHLDNLQGTESYTYNQRIETSVIETIFGTSGTAAKIYAIANFRSDDENVTLSSTATIYELKSTVIATAAFAGTDAQDDFVMDSAGNDEVTYNSSTRSISGEIKLYRAASKISLSIAKVDAVNVTDENGNTIMWDHDNQEATPEVPVKWIADTDKITARFVKGVKQGCIDGYANKNDIAYYDTPIESPVKMEKNTTSNSWEHSLPFYSYVSDWSTQDSHEEAYISLVVPWAKSDVPGVYHNTYYKVPISTDNKLERNKYYKINLIVSRLGRFDDGSDVVLTPASYYILDWSTNTIETELLNYRYLVVDQKEYTIYNQNELYIPFATSHTAVIDEDDVKVTFAQQDIKGTTPTWTTITSNSSNYFTDLEIVGNQVYFKNVLDNVYTSSTFDFTPYRLTFRIKHTGTAGNTYYEDITVYQYPAIYGTPETNWDYSNNYLGSGTDGENGFTYVNGYQGTNNGNRDFFGSVNGLSGNSDSSPNRYVFTISSVEGTNYIIGDPRENSITYNESSANWATAPVLENGLVSSTTRELKNYYGTDVSDAFTTTSTNRIYNSDAAAEAAERTINMVAPKFRIASGYAVLNTGGSGMDTLENLKKRCASYQEDGYPAGRWRLPTRAEFQFIVSLVNREFIPQIYIDDTAYWCAHGVGTPDDDGNVAMKYVGRDGSGHSTRCVYDEWYWEDKLETPAQKNVFTWGDMPR